MWYYQIQGQLYVTRRRGCIFGVWTGQQFAMKVEYILFNKNFWETKMEGKLVNFYLNCILPELVDPRHTRKLKIREPAYILQAQREKKNSIPKKKKSVKRKLF